MNKNAPIILGIIAALFGAFMIVGNMPITVEDFEGNLTVDGNLNVTGTGEFGGDVDMNQYYLLYSPTKFEYLSSLTAGRTNVEISHTVSGLFTQDEYISFGMLHLDIAPGALKWVNVTITNGIDSLFFAITGADTSDIDMTGFLWDVSDQSFVIQYTQSAGGASLAAYIHGESWYVETP